jgi:Uma2 family endonuclease
MSQQQPASTTFVSPDAFLAWEEQAADKHEYIDGEVIPLPGASLAHVRITTNTLVALDALDSADFTVAGSDLRVWIPTMRRYTYPDITVVAGPARLLPGWRTATLLNPTLIVEVLSESTAEQDRGAKFAAYQTIESFREYILIDQYEVHLTQHTREADGTWQAHTYTELDDMVHLASVPARLPLRRVYRQVFT